MSATTDNPNRKSVRTRFTEHYVAIALAIYLGNSAAPAATLNVNVNGSVNGSVLMNVNGSDQRVSSYERVLFGGVNGSIVLTSLERIEQEQPEPTNLRAYFRIEAISNHSPVTVHFHRSSNRA